MPKARTPTTATDRAAIEGCSAAFEISQAELLAFGREEDQARSLDAVSRAASTAQLRLVRASALGAALSGLGADVTALAVLVLAVRPVSDGSADGVQLAVVTLATLAAFEAVAALPAAWSLWGAMRESAGRLFDLEDQPPAVVEPALPPPPVEPRALEVRDLSFRHPGSTRPALAGVSLRLEPDRRVAVVGPSGAGKSTLVHVLLRFLDVPEGTVLLGGVDVRRWPSDRVRAAIGFAAQRVQLFTGTLRDNLRLAAPDAGDAELLAALAAARLDPIVVQLPRGLDTWLGEQGHQLSGGERQRLALARALLRRDAPFLVLDEPTAHLDAVTEREVVAAVVRAGEGRATLLVTHRLVGLEAFDEVLVLEEGRVVERGPAAGLAAAGGAFSRLLAHQRATRPLEELARKSGLDGGAGVLA